MFAATVASAIDSIALAQGSATARPLDGGRGAVVVTARDRLYTVLPDGAAIDRTSEPWRYLGPAEVEEHGGL